MAQPNYETSKHKKSESRKEIKEGSGEGPSGSSSPPPPTSKLRNRSSPKKKSTSGSGSGSSDGDSSQEDEDIEEKSGSGSGDENEDEYSGDGKGSAGKEESREIGGDKAEEGGKLKDRSTGGKGKKEHGLGKRGGGGKKGLNPGEKLELGRLMLKGTDKEIKTMYKKSSKAAKDVPASKGVNKEKGEDLSNRIGARSGIAAKQNKDAKMTMKPDRLTAPMVSLSLGGGNPDSNLAFSPLSLEVALEALLLASGEGEAREQLKRLLGIGDEGDSRRDIRDISIKIPEVKNRMIFRDMLRQQRVAEDDDKDTIASCSNRLLVDRDVEVGGENKLALGASIEHLYLSLQVLDSFKAAMKTIEVEIKKFKEDSNSSVSTGVDSEKEEKSISPYFFVFRESAKTFVEFVPFHFSCLMLQTQLKWKKGEFLFFVQLIREGCSRFWPGEWWNADQNTQSVHLQDFVSCALLYTKGM